MDGDRSKCDNTHLFHFRRSAEEIEKPVGNQLEGGCAAEHHADRKHHGKFKGFIDSPFVFGSVVESQNRDQAVVKVDCSSRSIYSDNCLLREEILLLNIYLNVRLY